MKKNIQRKSKFKSKKINHSFTGTMLTRYAGLSPIMKYFNNIGLGQKLNDVFSTDIYNSTKFTNAQVLLSVMLASLSGVHRLKGITHFTGDPLVMAILGLKKQFNKDMAHPIKAYFSILKIMVDIINSPKSFETFKKGDSPCPPVSFIKHMV